MKLFSGVAEERIVLCLHYIYIWLYISACLSVFLGRYSSIVPIRVLAVWHKRQPEPSFNFIRFSFAYVIITFQ